MNYAELVAAVTEEVSKSRPLAKADVSAVLGALSEVTKGAIQQGEEVVLKDLGKFGVKAKPARTGRNPATGEALQIAAKNVPTFSLGKALKDAANSN